MLDCGGCLKCYCPVTSMTSSSELSPPFTELWCLSGWVKAAPSRLEAGLLKWERKPDAVELEFGAENPPVPGRRVVGNIVGAESSD